MRGGAGELLQEAGLADRVERRVMDLADSGSEVEAADFVVMNPVICCYSSADRCTGQGGDRAQNTRPDKGAHHAAA